MKNHQILPFYMTYPLSFGMEDNREMLKDLEYMQQMYPEGAKLLQNEINKSINIYDYRGSMIYDEYPDRFLLYKMGKEILEGLKRNKEQYQDNKQYMMLLEWEGIEEFIIVLLFYEILKRRHKGWDFQITV